MSRVLHLKAGELAGVDTLDGGYLLRSVDDAPDDWRLVTTRVPPGELWPNRGGPGSAFLPPLVTVTYADGSDRVFNPDDQVEIKPA